MSKHAGRQRLSVQDAGFLYLEHAGLPQHVAILAVAEGGPLHDPEGRLRLDALRQELAGRLQLVPRLRQRVLCPRVGQGLPLSVDDPGFDLANHVRTVQVPAPGGQRELLGLCDELCLRLLDRARPLWELWLVTGLAEGRVGLVLKLHHSLADGLAAVQIAGLLLDGTANAPNPAAPWQPRPAPSGWALLADNLAGRSATLAAALARLRHPGKLAAQARTLAGAAQLAAGGRRHRRRSVLRRPVGGRRRLAVVGAQLAEVKAVAHGHGATVNDLLLAAVTGGLRALLLARGAPVDGLILYASVPVALRAQADTAGLGNQVGLMVVPLPVGARPRPAAMASQPGHHRTQASPGAAGQPAPGRVVDHPAGAQPLQPPPADRGCVRHQRARPPAPPVPAGRPLAGGVPGGAGRRQRPPERGRIVLRRPTQHRHPERPRRPPGPRRLRRRPPRIAGGAGRGHTVPPGLSRAGRLDQLQ
jgi:diacylglycerol O-acyltransferase / wax synthase